jgi:hypothetical protein
LLARGSGLEAICGGCCCVAGVGGSQNKLAAVETIDLGGGNSVGVAGSEGIVGIVGATSIVVN